MEVRVEEMTLEEETGPSVYLINVDLDLEATFDLAPLVEALGTGVFVLYSGARGEYFEAHLELADEWTWDKDGATAIKRFVSLVEACTRTPGSSGTSRPGVTSTSGSKVATAAPHFEIAIKPIWLAAIAQLDARIVVAVYAPNDVVRFAPRIAARSLERT